MAASRAVSVSDYQEVGKGHAAKASRLSSKRSLMAEMAEAEKAWPPSSLAGRADVHSPFLAPSDACRSGDTGPNMLSISGWFD